MLLSRMILIGTILLSTQTIASEAVGFYSSGKLKDADSIITRGIAIHKLFMQRGRFYGTDTLFDTISDAADYVKNEYPDAEKLQVGDLSHKAGGKATGHGSHQNGLDVDMVYLTKNKKLQSKTASFWQEEFVKKGVLTANFDVTRNLNLFKYLDIVVNYSV